MHRRVVFDTNVALSALVFTTGVRAWLRQDWRGPACVPLVSRATVAELHRVFGYPKFRLTTDEAHELIAEYLPYCEVVEVSEKCPSVCRDPRDLALLDLAQSGLADLLVSGDRDLLALAGKTVFEIETPSAYRSRVFGE